MKLPKRLKWKHVSALYEAIAPALKASPAKLDSPEPGKVLVLAPHIDDESIGCGGAIIKHAMQGDPVMAVYFAGCTPERRKEADAAISILGISEKIFLEYEDKSLGSHPEIAEKLAATIREFRPDTVYLPSLFDRHNDHLAVNNYLCVAQKKSGLDFTVCAYEVWTPLVPNLAVDISAAMDRKIKAVSAFKSQTAVNDWVSAVEGLNRFRGITMACGKYAEAFIRHSAAKYRQMWEKAFNV
ncbi:MAG: PIG-L family deacetylase [Nitrospiraceae bacterium]|nr:PIG-L family deacetylase [Nitrospiraceae bacterium]